MFGVIAPPLNASVRRPTMTRSVLMLGVAAVALCACDSTGDTARVDSVLDTTPDWGCIASVVRSVQTVDVVREDTNPTGRRITWRGVGPPGIAKTLVYRVGGVSFALQVIDEPGESI